MKKETPKQSIAVVGGGITGIAAALGLVKSGHFQVTIFEKADLLGGMSSSYQWQDVVCDRFYHVILSADTYLIDFLKDLGLESQLFWKDTLSGFYGDRQLVSFSSAVDFLRFPFLSLWQKFRLGAGILYSSRIHNVREIDKVYARDWLTKVFGAKVYDNFWEPLLRSKLGQAKDKISAAFILATIKRLYGARSSASKQEKMGHVHGGYRTILEAARRKLTDLDVAIRTNSPVLKAEIQGDTPKITLTTPSERTVFDRVLFTVSCPVISQIMGDYQKHAYWNSLKNIEYLGVLCVLLISKVSFSPYYVINLLDEELPFTGIIESTNVLSSQEVGGKHLLYLPKYLSQNDPLVDYSDEEVIELFMRKLEAVFPGLKDDDIEHRALFREEYVQPVQGLNSLDSFNDPRTPVRGIYVGNALSIKDSTLNNNAAITVALMAVKTILEDGL